MVSRDDVESFLIRMDLDWEEVGEGMFLVRDRKEDPPLVIHHSPPFLILQIKVMDLPEDRDGLGPLYRTLLELNASDIVHGAYGIEDREVLLSDTLQLEALDFVEFQSSLESLQLAISSHLERLSQLASTPEEA